MRYCSTCGTLNDTDAKFCSGCGKQFENAPDEPVEVYTSKYTYDQPDDTIEPGYYTEEEPYYYEQPAAQPVFTRTQSQAAPVLPPKARVFGIISFVFGLITICWSWVAMFPIVGQIMGVIFLAMAIVGIIFSGKSLQDSSFRLARAGKILCIIGLIFVVLSLAIGIAALASGVFENSYEYLEDIEQYF